MKKLLNLSVIFLSLIFVMGFAGITVFAEPEEEPSAQVTEPVEEQTEPPVQPTEQETQPPTQPPTQAPTQTSTQPPSETVPSKPEQNQQQTEQPSEQTTGSVPEENETTQPTEPEETETAAPPPEEPSYNIDDLPPIDENEFIVPTSIITETPPQTATAAAGIISWICVAVGVIVIITILGSSKTGNYMNGGKQRYESGDIISGGKHR